MAGEGIINKLENFEPYKLQLLINDEVMDLRTRGRDPRRLGGMRLNQRSFSQQHIERDHTKLNVEGLRKLASNLKNNYRVREAVERERLRLKEKRPQTDPRFRKERSPKKIVLMKPELPMPGSGDSALRVINRPKLEIKRKALTPPLEEDRSSYHSEFSKIQEKVMGELAVDCADTSVFEIPRSCVQSEVVQHLQHSQTTKSILSQEKQPDAQKSDEHSHSATSKSNPTVKSTPTVKSIHTIKSKRSQGRQSEICSQLLSDKTEETHNSIPEGHSTMEDDKSYLSKGKSVANTTIYLTCVDKPITDTEDRELLLDDKPTRDSSSFNESKTCACMEKEARTISSQGTETTRPDDFGSTKAVFNSSAHTNRRDYTLETSKVIMMTDAKKSEYWDDPRLLRKYANLLRAEPKKSRSSMTLPFRIPKLPEALCACNQCQIRPNFARTAIDQYVFDNITDIDDAHSIVFGEDIRKCGTLLMMLFYGIGCVCGLSLVAILAWVLSTDMLWIWANKQDLEKRTFLHSIVQFVGGMAFYLLDSLLGSIYKILVLPRNAVYRGISEEPTWWSFEFK